jgi:two-component system LytT family sensor kinase
VTKRLAKTYFWSIVCWSALSPFLAIQWWLNSNSSGMKEYYPLRRFLLMVFSNYLSLALLTPVLFLIIRRWPIRKPYAVRRGAMYLLGAIPFMAVVPGIRSLILPPWDVTAGQWMPRTFESFYGLMISRFAETLIMYVLIVWAGHAFELHDRSRIQAIEQSDLKRAVAESELQMLKTQLHPHFLFNTLQGISSLTEENPRLAKQMVVALGDLLRAALKHSSVDLVSLQTEMEFVSAYLDLEKMRLGERLTIRVHISAEARECLVPQLLLQPLVENAIVHGIANSRSGGWVEIRSELNEQHLRLRVENSTSEKAFHGAGVGLTNTRARLAHLYMEDASLTFGLTPRGSAEAVVVIPVLKGSMAACTTS